jgi:hypothetical protein
MKVHPLICREISFKIIKRILKCRVCACLPVTATENVIQNFMVQCQWQNKYNKNRNPPLNKTFPRPAQRNYSTVDTLNEQAHSAAKKGTIHLNTNTSKTPLKKKWKPISKEKVKNKKCSILLHSNKLNPDLWKAFVAPITLYIGHDYLHTSTDC